MKKQGPTGSICGGGASLDVEYYLEPFPPKERARLRARFLAEERKANRGKT
jgi:hypothetical protein